ncbi:Fe-S cluster assembly protein NifU [Baaleninema sp.]|uniref:Fe-S cluster assembly protein NifU n=1 Tax=Baaleninema sp. TaxID=3101197 RepID=UPI003D02B4F0
MWNYSDKVMDLFLNPHNLGAIAPEECNENETLAVGEVGSIVCGDALRLHLKIDRPTETITDARFQTFGCASAIASSSALTDLIKGMTVDGAAKLTNREIAEFLEGLPEEKMHCSVMGQEALESAIANYRGVELEPHEDDDGALVCTCFAVSEERIRRTILENHLTDAEQVTNYVKAGGGCGSCLAAIDDILAEVNESYRETTVAVETAMANQKQPLTTLQKIVKIQQVLENDVRPALQADGGDLELYDIDGDCVKVILKGACDGCPSVSATLKLAIEKRLQDAISPSLVVEAVKSTLAASS